MIFKNMDEVRKHLKMGFLLPVYLVYGNDDYRKQGVIHKLNALTTDGGSGFDTHHFDGKTSADEIADAAFEITFGGNKRCIIAEDIPFNSMSENEYSKFEELISEVISMNGETVLIFSFITLSAEKKKKEDTNEDSEAGSNSISGAKKKNYIESLKKFIDSNGGGIINCDFATNSELATMMEKEAAKYKCTLDRDIAIYIIERCGSDSSLLRNEVKKISEYKGNGNITINDVNIMTSPSPDASVFELTKRISARDENGAHTVIAELFERGEPVQLVMSILASAYMDLLRAKCARNEGVTNETVISDYPKEYKKKVWKYENAASAQGRYTKSALSKCMNILFEADMKMKTTNVDGNLILDETVARLFEVK